MKAITNGEHPIRFWGGLILGGLGVVLPTVFYLESVVNIVQDAHAYDVQAAEVEAARDISWQEVDQLTQEEIRGMKEQLTELRTEVASAITALHHLEDEIARDKGDVMFALGKHEARLENLLVLLDRMFPDG